MPEEADRQPPVQHLPEVTDENDRELARDTERMRPGSDAPSRAGITGTGSGADGERG